MNNLKYFFIGFKNGMNLFAESIAVIINSLLLCLVYFFGVGFTSIFAKLTGKHFFDLKISKSKKTYWSNVKINIKNHYRQF